MKESSSLLCFQKREGLFCYNGYAHLKVIALHLMEQLIERLVVL